MRTTATLLLLTAIGCGGADKTDTTPAVDSRVPEPTAPATSAAETAPPAETAPSPEAAPAEATPAAAPAEPAPTAASARADLKMLSGDKSLGTITFERSGNIVSINGQFSGLKKGQHALFIHSKGDCSDRGRKVGAHLNPTNTKHGPPASAERHAGDFGDLTFDKDGNATFAMETDSITLEPDRADSVVGRAVVVYSRKDSKSGKAGSPMACGVVMLDGAEPSAAEATPAAPPPTATKTSASAR